VGVSCRKKQNKRKVKRVTALVRIRGCFSIPVITFREQKMLSVISCGEKITNE